MGAEGESRSEICESLRQKDSVKDTKEKRVSRRYFLYFEWIVHNDSKTEPAKVQNGYRDIEVPGIFPRDLFQFTEKQFPVN